MSAEISVLCHSFVSIPLYNPRRPSASNKEEGLGVGAWGLGVGGWGLWFGVWGLGLRV
jgi:hypothetical protein